MMADAEHIDTPTAPALGWYAMDDAVEIVEHTRHHDHCGRATGGGGLHLEVTGWDGIATLHDVSGLKLGCVIGLLTVDERVRKVRLRMLEMDAWGRVVGG